MKVLKNVEVRCSRSAWPTPVGAVLATAVLLVSVPASLASQERPTPDAVEGRPPSARLEAGASLLPPSPEEFGLLPGRPRVTPTRTDSPPVVDGILNDAVWRTAAHLTEFTQQSPLDGAPATEGTDVYIAYDSEHIYFGFHAHYEDPSIMRANRVERDRASMDDLMTIYFDTFLDQQRGYDFDVNGYGVQGDGVITAGGFRGGGGRGGGSGAIPPADRSWNTLFETAGQIVEDGFTAEMAIPFKSLRYPSPEDGEPHRWGFQIVREVKGKDAENQVWAPMSRDETSFFAQMGLIEGMTDLSTSRNLEILPTFTAIQYGDIDPTQPAFVTQSTDADAGVNIKYGVTSNLTADFTINPDFSQIESDRPQIEVNQRFPLFFAELRPFFVEGAEIFRVIAPLTLVHTRTIVDPDYGAKLTGQLGRFTVGALTANDRAPGRVDDTSDRAFNRTAQTFIGRVKYDLYAESSIGVILTDREFLSGHSRLLEVDGAFRLSPTISGGANAAGTRHKNPGGAEVGGNFLGVRINRNARHVTWSAWAYQISPDFRTDVGFVRRRDQRNFQGSVGYRFWPESWIINWGPNITYNQTYNFDGVLQDENINTRVNFSFSRNISLNGGYRWNMERFGGINFQQNTVSMGGRVNTSRSYSFGANFSMGDQIYFLAPSLGRQVNWSVNGSVRPTDGLQTDVSFNSRRLTDPLNGDAELFDVRIVRAQTTLQLSERLGLRNIIEYRTDDKTLDINILFNYRVNAGTVVYVGYDDHYQQADLIEGDRDGDGFEEQLYFARSLRRTNRAIFAKFQYLIRY